MTANRPKVLLCVLSGGFHIPSASSDFAETSWDSSLHHPPCSSLWWAWNGVHYYDMTRLEQHSVLSPFADLSHSPCANQIHGYSHPHHPCVYPLTVNTCSVCTHFLQLLPEKKHFTFSQNIRSFFFGCNPVKYCSLTDKLADLQVTCQCFWSHPCHYHPLYQCRYQSSTAVTNHWYYTSWAEKWTVLDLLIFRPFTAVLCIRPPIITVTGAFKQESLQLQSCMLCQAGRWPLPHLIMYNIMHEQRIWMWHNILNCLWQHTIPY